jgi:LAGLIDADG endonuclease
LVSNKGILIFIIKIYIYIERNNLFQIINVFKISLKTYLNKENWVLGCNKRNYSKDYKLYNLSYYLAGLIEGDGHFNTPKVLKGPSGKKRVAAIEIVFALKDKPLAELLKYKLGGNVYGDSKKKMVRWMIQDIKSVVFIINLINGKLRTPKINGLYKMIDFLKLKGVNIEKLPIDNSSLIGNAWLTGFIDADGHFAIKGFTQNVRTYIGIQFIIAQRVKDISGKSLEEIMQKIAKFLLVKLHRNIINKKYEEFRINTSNYDSNKILINYLNTFPLLSSKYLDFKDWEIANYVYVNKLHKDLAQYERIRLLKFNMNKGRILFTWSHHSQTIYNL